MRWFRPSTSLKPGTSPKPDWRDPRLHAIIAAMGRMSHDLRGILSAALLVSDRLTTHADPNVRRAGEVLVDAVLRATALSQQTMDYVRLAPPPLPRTNASLHALVAATATATASALRRDNQVPAAATAMVHEPSMLLVLAELFANANAAGARHIGVNLTGAAPHWVLLVEDDGRGVPAEIEPTLFRTGGSMIARDLMRAQGGDLTLDETSAAGTRFAVHLKQQG